MSDRLDELAMRRRMLLLRSERLRADLALDQRVMLDALSGVDRAYTVAKRAVRPVLFAAAGLMLLRFLWPGRRHSVTDAAAEAFSPDRGHSHTHHGHRGFMMRALFWVTMAQRAMPYIQLAHNLWRSRSRQRYADERAEAEQAL